MICYSVISKILDDDRKMYGDLSNPEDVDSLPKVVALELEVEQD